jgi:hypothetical protein
MVRDSNIPDSPFPKGNGEWGRAMECLHLYPMITSLCFDTKYPLLCDEVIAELPYIYNKEDAECNGAC